MVAIFIRNFEYHLNLGSFLPLFIFIIGIYINYLFINSEFSQGVFAMMLVFVIYVTNNIIININKSSSVFNEYLEDIASFTAFGISEVIFGLMFFKENYIVLSITIFYSVTLVLALARNWILQLKNSLGWPIALNGVFFPLIYYIYLFYLGDQADSIFILFFILIGVLLVSTYNFVGYDESISKDKNKKESKDEDNKEENLEEEMQDENKEEELNLETNNEILPEAPDTEKINDIIDSLKEKNN